MNNYQMTEREVWARAFLVFAANTEFTIKAAVLLADESLVAFRERYPTDIDEEEVTPREAFEALKEHVAQGKYIAPKPVAARRWEVEHCKVIEVLEGGSRSLTYIAIDTLEAAKMVVILNRVYALGQENAK